MCRNMLHDNPHRPIAPSDFQSAVFTFESSDREHEAFMTGVGAVRQDFVSASDLESALRHFGLPVAGSKRTQWRLAYSHVNRRLSRKFIIEWLRHFDFHLFATEAHTGRRVAIDPNTLPKRLLLALLGEFATGDVVCSRNPGLAISLTPLSHMLEHFRAKGVAVPQAEQQDVFAVFPRFCLDKRARKGSQAPSVIAQLRSADDTHSPMAVIDALLEEGIYATNQLTEEEQLRVSETLGMKNRSGAGFETELKPRLETYLRDFNGIFLKLWLDEHNPSDTQAFGLDNMLAHYVNINICTKGYRSSSLNPELPQTGSAAVHDVLHTATILAAALPGNEEPEVKVNDPALVDACTALNLPPSDEQKTVASVLSEAKEAKPRATRSDEVAAVSCLLDMLYMKFSTNTDLPKVTWLVSRIEAVLRTLDLEPNSPTTAVEARYLDYMLWMEQLASPALLRKLFEVRVTDERLSPAATKRQLLDLLSDSNIERMWIVERWAKEQHKGTLCFGTDQELQRKLDVLKVNTDNMSKKRKEFYFVSLLHIYLHDDVVLKFLTEKDQRAMQQERREVNFSSCYETYCTRMGKEQNAIVAGAYNGKLAFRFMIKYTDRSKLGNTPECAVGQGKTASVTAATRKVFLLVPNSMGTIRVLQKDPVTGFVDEYSVSSGGDEGVVFVQTFTGSDAELPTLTAYYMSRHDKLVKVDDETLSST
jgi:hypothetical protein